MNGATPVEPSRAPVASWKLSQAEFAIEDGNFTLDDRSLARPVPLELSAVNLQLQNAALDGTKLAP